MWTRLWNASAPLTVTGVVMIAVLAATIVGLAVDPRLVTGVPVWLKPAKFAASISIYTLTLAGTFTLIPEFVRTRRLVGWTTAVTMILEIAIIGLQAFRGTTSHFNVATPLDMALFAIMGSAIVVQTVSAVAVAAALWRHPFGEDAVGWALRFGILITIAGASIGGLMTRPTPQQLDAARAGERMTIAGAHTVGAADGGPGLPGTGWSTRHGDLRVPHFVGLHAIQVLPVMALVFGRLGVVQRARLRLTVTAAASYAVLLAILLSQALRGQSVLAPDALTLTWLAVWALVTVTATAATAIRLRPAGPVVA
jgi:hypothetical protein